jgi:type IV secretory pathway VirJ component
MRFSLIQRSLAGLAGLVSLISPAAQAATPENAPPAGFVTGTIPAPHLSPPVGDSKALVFLLSDAAGWSSAEAAMATTLSAAGAFVVGIDLPAYLQQLEKQDADECVYTLSDIERLSQQIQRSTGGSVYHLPIVAGIGAGGAMALAIAAQTPDATVGHTVAVDPAAGIALTRPLCTPATRKEAKGLAVYGLTDGALPAPITVALTAQAPAEGRRHVEALAAEHPDIATLDSDSPQTAALADAVTAVIETPDDDALGMPLAVLETQPTRDTMAIIYSGDGGWRDIDKSIGEHLQANGVPTIGVDSLRYFWKEISPEQTATDLARIIKLYTKRWGVKNVVLVGFSFGADILPTTFNLLAAPEKDRVKEVSLLAVSKSADFEISVMGWLGAAGNSENLTQLARIDPRLVQCFYGTEDDDTVCPAVKNLGFEFIAVEGGHHFDGDYDALADRILVGLTQRLPAPAAPAKP